MTIAIPRLDRTTAAERGLTLADFLVPISVGERLNARVRHILLIVIGALFVFLTAAQIYIPDPRSVHRSDPGRQRRRLHGLTLAKAPRRDSFWLCDTQRHLPL